MDDKIRGREQECSSGKNDSNNGDGECNDIVEQSAIVTLSDTDRGPLLRSPSSPCEFPLDDNDTKAISDMHFLINDVLNEDAYAIAAVQIGYPKRIFVVREGDDSFVAINPKVISKSKETTSKSEGCLSIPGFLANPIRPKSIKISYMDIDGNELVRSFSGLDARVICHEMDHLEGVLLIDHMEKQYYKSVVKKESAAKQKESRVARLRAKEKLRRKAARKQRRN